MTGPRRVAQHRAAIAAAKAAGVEHVAYTSLVGVAEGNPAAVAADHLATERALADVRPDVTVLRNSWYADTVAGRLAPAAAETGRWTINTGEGRVAPVAKEDVAAAAAAVLTTDGHVGATYDITGPDLHTVGELAAMTSEHHGARGRASTTSTTTRCARSSLSAGVDRPGDLVSFGTAIREGWFAVCSGGRGAARRAAGAADARAPGGVARLTVDQKAVLRIGAGRTAGVWKRAARSRSSTTRQSASTHDPRAHLRLAGLAVAEADRHLADARAGAQRAVGDLDLEAEAGGLEAAGGPGARAARAGST